jgi:hypothetical protein
MAFESKEEATQRQNLEKVQGKKRKSPVDKFDKMEWDKEAMKGEVMSYGDGTLVNCSEYGISVEAWQKMVVKLPSNGLNQNVLMWKDLRKGKEKMMQEM